MLCSGGGRGKRRVGGGEPPPSRWEKQDVFTQRPMHRVHLRAINVHLDVVLRWHAHASGGRTNVMLADMYACGAVTGQAPNMACRSRKSDAAGLGAAAQGKLGSSDRKGAPVQMYQRLTAWAMYEVLGAGDVLTPRR